ncbi:MAG: FAD-dependent oxidoreductase [Actinobacteria bacterium]|nr:FAD-dependent oxidoreductase [Actinomycetota bacterium]
MGPQEERVETVVIGGGQAGLAVGYHLARRGLPFVILDANERIGGAWRKRWDSLRVFTPARFNGLPGMPFPGARHSFPTKDEVADYLEGYATRFELPVRTGTRVQRLSKDGGYEVSTDDHVWHANNVVVAMGTHQVAWIPPFAGELDPAILQLDAGNYRNPDQLHPGPTLVVGAGSSGAEIALDVAPSHQTWLSGRHPGHVPFRIESRVGRVLVPVIIGFAFHNVVTIRTPIGRKVRPKLLSEGKAWIRAKPRELAAAGIERVPRVVGVQDGLPELEDGRVLAVRNVVWCTGFRPDFSWIDLDVFGTGENPIEPVHERGVIHSEPGLYFVGLFFLYAGSSELLRGVGRDAEYVVEHIAKNRTETAQGSSRVTGVAAF